MSMRGYLRVRYTPVCGSDASSLCSQKKQTPLHLAAADGQLEVCRLLLELGASIDATDELGQKPIHVAAQNNYSAVVALFLQKHPQLVGATTKVTSSNS